MPSITNDSFDFGTTARHIRHLLLGQECVRDFLQRVCEMPQHCAECPSETGCVATGSFSYSLMPSITTVAVLRGRGWGLCDRLLITCTQWIRHCSQTWDQNHAGAKGARLAPPIPSACAAPAGRSLGRRLTVTSSLYSMSFCILANGVSGQCMVERISRASGCTWYRKVPNSNPLADAINPFILDLSRGAPCERTLGASFRLSRRALF